MQITNGEHRVFELIKTRTISYVHVGQTNPLITSTDHSLIQSWHKRIRKQDILTIRPGDLTICDLGEAHSDVSQDLTPLTDECIKTGFLV